MKYNDPTDEPVLQDEDGHINEGVIAGLCCPECSEESIVLMGGCTTCISCGWSKCG